MKRILIGVIMLGLLAAALPVTAATLYEEVEQAQALAKEWKLAEAEQHALAAIEAAKAQGLDQLSGSELMLLGDAHLLATACIYQRALQIGSLDGDQVKRARELCRKVLGLRDMKVVGMGQKVDLEAELVPGKTNIVDFFSEYCGPCVQLAPYLEALVDNQADVFLIKVDINRPDVKGIDWESPTAQQFRLQSIPHLRIYGPDGKLQAEGNEARERVMKMIQDTGVE